MKTYTAEVTIIAVVTFEAEDDYNPVDAADDAVKAALFMLDEDEIKVVDIEYGKVTEVAEDTEKEGG